MYRTKSGAWCANVVFCMSMWHICMRIPGEGLLAPRKAVGLDLLTWGSQAAAWVLSGRDFAWVSPESPPPQERVKAVITNIPTCTAFIFSMFYGIYIICSVCNSIYFFHCRLKINHMQKKSYLFLGLWAQKRTKNYSLFTTNWYKWDQSFKRRLPKNVQTWLPKWRGLSLHTPIWWEIWLWKTDRPVMSSLEENTSVLNPWLKVLTHLVPSAPHVHPTNPADLLFLW
jgi:hypothetical protein